MLYKCANINVLMKRGIYVGISMYSHMYLYEYVEILPRIREPGDFEGIHVYIYISL